MVARADGDGVGDVKSVGECDLADVVPKKLDRKQPDHSPTMRKVNKHCDHHSQSRRSSPG